MPTLSRTVVLDADMDREASQILARIGMSVDDALQLLLTQVIEQHDLPLSLRPVDPNMPGAPPYADIGDGKRFATYDAWFRYEVEAAIREADDPNCVWVSHEEVKRRMAARRIEWQRRMKEKEAAS